MDSQADLNSVRIRERFCSDMVISNVHVQKKVIAIVVRTFRL